MTLPLPPKSIVRCDSATAQYVHDQLTSVIVGHAQATTTYRFYEELDAWLGPWGPNGYPIGYGKFYNVAFSTNEKLMMNPQTKNWVWHTSILLQEALRDYVVNRIRDCTLPSITEAELRQAAFDSHPAAYDQGGLAMVALTAPGLIFVIATIPGREFSPDSDNFNATIKQVLITAARISDQMVGNSMAAAAGPAHTGVLTRAVRRDQQRLLNEMALTRELTAIITAIERGEVDHIPALDRIINQFNLRQFPDQGYAQMARGLVQAAERRRKIVIENLNHLLIQSPPVRQRVHSKFPNFVRP